jgi:hypothetical protein
MLAFQGGLLMPIKEGGKLRSPRAHATAVTQEISEYWEVDWANVKLVFIPLCDGKNFIQIPLRFSFISALIFGETNCNYCRLQKAWRSSGQPLVSLDLCQSRL